MLDRPTPPVDVSTLQASVESLRADIDMIFEARVSESQAPSAEPAEDTKLAALFSTSDIRPTPPREHAKRAGVVTRMRLGQGRKSARRWRLRGEPELMKRRRIRFGL